MPTFTYPELAEDLGTATGDGLRNVANAAANFACALHRDYAKATSGFPDPTGVGAFNNALWSRLCGPRGIEPPPPQVPFEGGQCPIRYNVLLTGNIGGGNPDFNALKANVLGPIQGIVSVTFPNGIAGKGLQAAPDPPAFPTGYIGQISGSPDDKANWTLNVTSVVPVSGPDECGDPDPQFPDDTIPPDRITQPDVNINIGAGVFINAPITYIPVRLNADIDVNANFQVNVGPFNVSFGPFGIDVNPVNPPSDPPPQIPSDDYLPPNAPPSRPVDPGAGSGECPSVNLQPVLDELNALDDAVADVAECACPVSYDLNNVALGSGTGGVFPLPNNAIAVRLLLTQIPENAKTQEGRGGHPEQLFCGYYEWGDGIGLSERIPISVQSSYFTVPLHATSFAFNLYLGYVASATAIVANPEKPGAQFRSVQMFPAPQ